MKLSCQIVQDLLPLYEDDICSQESKACVEEHLSQCDKCKTLIQTVKNIPTITQASIKEEEAVKKGFRKIKRRWIASIIAVAMILPLFFIGKLGYNEYRKEGICFTNLNELWSCNRYLNALEDGDIRDAVSYIDFSKYYAECAEAIALQPQDFMANYVELSIGQESWMAYKWFAEQYLPTGEDEVQTWSYLIFNSVPEVLIPIDIWEKIIAQGNNVDALQNHGYRMPNGNCYFPYETKWGTFMVTDVVYDALIQDDDLKLSQCVAMLPKQMYLELKPSMEEEAQASYQAVQERMQDVIGLNEKEFAAYMTERYEQRLSQLKDEIKIVDFSFENAFYALGQWNISYCAKISYQGEVCKVRFQFYAKDGCIAELYAIGMDRNGYKIENILNVFMPRI